MLTFSVWPRLPTSGPDQRIGLLGGSFNPAHSGHRHISLLALKRLGLDAIWWLVTPGNPLKDHSELANLETRLANAKAIADHPRIKVTGFEAQAGSLYTADTLKMLRQRCPNMRFVWLMGADNLAGFHHWNQWQRIVQSMPIAVIDRPGATDAALASPAGRAMARFRVPNDRLRLLPEAPAPAWGFVFGPLSPESSTRLRRGES